MKTIRNIRKIDAFRNDPFGFIADMIITVIVNLVIPIPLAGEALKAFRGPVLGCLASALILGLFMLVVVGTIVLSPFIVSASFLQRFTSLIPSTLSVSFDDSFAETSVPQQNPFGGPGMTYTAITAFFHDPRYFLNFGRIHTGADLVPTLLYYATSKTYKETGQVIAFSTINGTARFYVDEYGGETVEITNSDNTFRVKYIHFKKVLVTGGNVKAGTPVGIMGDTGLATGEHVHYEIQVNSGGKWTPVNPLPYIQ